MKRLSALLVLFIGLAGSALAQQVTNPIPNAGAYGAYNAVAPTCVTGTGCWIQTDINGNLKVNIAAGSAGGLSVTDQAAWTQAVSPFTPTGGVFSDASTLSAGQQGTARLTTKRAQIVDVDTSGNALYTALTAATPAGTNVIGTVGYSSQYPVGATPYTATATGTTGATTATLAGASSVTTYLCGFSIRANATAAATNNATVTGVITATMNFTQWTAPLASGIGLTEMIFQPCIPASGTNQSIAVVSGAPGSGGVVSVSAWGYKL